MELGRTKRARLIRKFLMNAIRAGDSQFIHHAMETFHISRQAIFNHLKFLIRMGYLTATGNTRARVYILGPNRSHSARFPLSNLDESTVYYRDFGFIFSDLSRDLENICHYGFTEILNNAIDHSGGTTATVKATREEGMVTIRISDDGEGIFDHIARVFKLSDPRASLFELSKGKLTTDPDNHTGQGIFFTSRAFDNFYIFSGDLIFSHQDGDANDYLLHNERERKGTHVYMSISAQSEKNLKSIFDDFTGSEEEDFVFNKTVVPVKLALYEGERLISRSQAKRILNRVENFKTVLLDFQGVDMIGQAFADEVFRVFARKNPRVDLIPIKVTAEVAKTIQAAQSSKD